MFLLISKYTRDIFVEVNKLPIFRINDNNKSQKQNIRFGVSCPNLAPLKQDTVSFKGNVLKKSDFDGIDFAVIEKYKINPQQLKSKAKLQDIAQEKIEELDKEYGGRQYESYVERINLLKEWFNYVNNENDAYSYTQRLIILSAITKDLKPSNDTLPPVLNKGVLADTVTELERILKNNPKENFDFNKMYQNNLRAYYLEDSSTGETMTGWIVIPSKINDPENFENNIEKLKTLSHKNWCTKSFNAKPYLSEGDFHVYLENGKPKLGVRFVGDSVEEIQGEKNDGKIPQRYLRKFESYKRQANLKLNSFAHMQVANGKEKELQISIMDTYLHDVKEVKNIDDAIKVFEYIGIQAKKMKDGTLTLSHYRQPSEDLTFDDLGINEDKLIEYVSKIEHFATFEKSEITKLPNLKYVGGDFNIHGTKIKSLGPLRTIGGDAHLTSKNLTNLGDLKHVGGNFMLCHSEIESLQNLETIGGSLNIRGTKLKDLGKLKSVGRNVYLGNYPTLKRVEFVNVQVGKNIEW